MMTRDTMSLNNYQYEAGKFAVYPAETGTVYCALKLAGEAGEVAEKIGKMIRDEGYNPLQSDSEMDAVAAARLAQELGDVLWYVARLAHHIGYNLNDIAQVNLQKLQSRSDRNVLKGSGDDR